MTADEIGVMLNLRATLSEYEHFMSQLSLMIERGVDVPLFGSMSFPMKDKLYKQVRDLVKEHNENVVNIIKGQWADHTESKFHRGEIVRDKISKKVYRVFQTGMVALQDVSDAEDTVPSLHLHETCLEAMTDDGK